MGKLFYFRLRKKKPEPRWFESTWIGHMDSEYRWRYWDKCRAMFAGDITIEAYENFVIEQREERLRKLS